MTLETYEIHYLTSASRTRKIERVEAETAKDACLKFRDAKLTSRVRAYRRKEEVILKQAKEGQIDNDERDVLLYEAYIEAEGQYKCHIIKVDHIQHGSGI
jgi:hypothetical protein